MRTTNFQPEPLGGVETIALVNRQREALRFFITMQGSKFHVWDEQENPVSGPVKIFILRKYVESQTLTFLI